MFTFAFYFIGKVILKIFKPFAQFILIMVVNCVNIFVKANLSTKLFSNNWI